MVQRAFEHWLTLEQESGESLLVQCPCINIGLPGSSVVEGVRSSVAQHQLPAIELDAQATNDRFPGLTVPQGYVGILEEQAGYLFVEKCVTTYHALARALGATIIDHCPVRHWNSLSQGHIVKTDRASYQAKSVVVTAGPWARNLLGLKVDRIRVMRQTLQWHGTSRPQDYRRDHFPIFLVDAPGGYFYGLPMIDARGPKIAQHYGAPELFTPEEIDRIPHPDDEIPVREFLNVFMPGIDGPMKDAQVCTYTLTPDRHFVIDRLPGQQSVAVAAGFSGHGFKFAPVVGEIMADLVIDGRTPWDLSLFRINRFTTNVF
jgi:sarcosine oxidase